MENSSDLISVPYGLMYNLQIQLESFLEPLTANKILTLELDISLVTSSGFYCQS